MTFSIAAPIGTILGIGYNEATFNLRSVAVGGSPRPVFNIDQLRPEISLFEQGLTNGIAVPVTAEMSPYDQLALPSDDGKFVQEQFARLFLGELRENFPDQVEFRNEIDFVLRNREAFEDFNIQALRNGVGNSHPGQPFFRPRELASR